MTAALGRACHLARIASAAPATAAAPTKALPASNKARRLSINPSETAWGCAQDRAPLVIWFLTYLPTFFPTWAYGRWARRDVMAITSGRFRRNICEDAAFR